MQDTHLLLQPQVYPSPGVCAQPYYRLSSYTRPREKGFPVPNSRYIFNCVELSRKGVCKHPPRSVDCAMQLRPKKSRNGYPWKHISSEKKCAVTIKIRYNFAAIDDDSVGNHLSVCGKNNSGH